MGLTDTPAKDAYFLWLCKQVWVPTDGRTYKGVLELMFETEFVWIIGNDENRLADARDLRMRYGKTDSKLTPVTFLEVMIALSRRFEFIVNGKAGKIAWQLMLNLKLDKFPDPINQNEWMAVRDILETVIWRTYGRNGEGGFFPLEHPLEDQSVVEIWYQMAAYINENHESFDL